MIAQAAAYDKFAQPTVPVWRGLSHPSSIRSTIIEYPSRTALMRRCADRIAQRLRNLISDKGRATLAVPGENAPQLLLEQLGRAALAWENVAITQTDERRVPTESLRFSHKLMSSTLFRGGAAAAEFAPLYDGSVSAGNNLSTVATTLRNAILPLDVAVFSIGSGPVFSPHRQRSTGLEKALCPDAPPVVEIRARGTLESRTILSARVLAGADRHILVIGRDTRTAIERAIALNDPIEAPICALLDGATLHYAE